MKQGRRLRDAKAERAAKKRRARKRKMALILFVELFVFVILLGIGFMMNKYGKFHINLFDDDEIIVNDGVQQEKYTTIALFGGDSREGELEAGTHADTIMIVSIDDDTKEVKIVSVYRDLLTMQVNGEIGKANSAYFKGGPKEAINMLNKNFDLDIQDYVTVDFKALSDVIDLLGGIEVDVTKNEAAEVNNYIDETAMVAKKEAHHIEAGIQTLDGVQAVTYARIRKNVGGDYARTERQRIVIQKLVEKVKQSDLSTINSIIDTVFEHVSTSFEFDELIGLAAGFMEYQLGETGGYAFEHADGNVEGIGSVVIPKGVVKNVEKLHGFLYPKEEYKVSEDVKKIATEIEALTGQAY